ncbi:MAG: histidine kinase [Roseburia sp.]|nr:histidine kinase [Roseburia sp.]
MNRRLLTFLILCWAAPIVAFFGFTTLSYQKGIIKKAEVLKEQELRNISSFASIRIGDAISLCQRPSYERTWENSWKNYRSGDITEKEYLQEVGSSLRGKFYLDERFHMYAYYQYGQETPDCFSSRVGMSYGNYIEKIQPKLTDIIESNSSYTYVRVIDGRIFIIRNLYTTMNYRRYGTLVVELNRDEVFCDVSADIRQNLIVCVGDKDSILNFTDVTVGNVMDAAKRDERSDLAEKLLQNYDGSSNYVMNRIDGKKYIGYLYENRHDNYNMGILLFAKRSEIYSSLYELYLMVAIMLLFFIPVFCCGIYFLRRQSQMPINRILIASRRMKEGEIGTVVGGGRMPNSEFQYLMENFDDMSAQVKYLFDYVYDEKLARKDAQIQALQAQINPHFLNNTLEMMNWQARMSGDAVVSKMIESLSTVLDYRMNRAEVKEIHLAEELQCTDAYFYIMSMRFGKRLQIEKEIDDELLYILVPPLILQPIVENAIVHGIEIVNTGSIRLKIFHDEEKVYFQVRNTGKKMTEANKQKIQAILTKMSRRFRVSRTGIYP